MITQIFKACLLAGLPLFLVSLCMISWMRKSDLLDDFEDQKGLKAAMQAIKQKRKKDKNKSIKKQSMVIDKWLYFGGGFYGLMSLVTYAHIEISEIFKFISDLFTIGLVGLFSSLGLNTIIDFIVNSFVNLLTAILWFGYWPDEVTMREPLIWLLAAYIGYWYGAKTARKLQRDPTEEFIKLCRNLKSGYIQRKNK